jgi:beta-mannosidase
MKKRFLLLLMLGFMVLRFQAQSKQMDLDQQWTFHEKDSMRSYPAQVPGNLVTDLFRAGKIPDPFFADNAEKLQGWLARTWEYHCDFTLEKNMLKYQHLQLVFDGLDTYASVYLNDSLLFTSDNMFVSKSVDIKRKIKTGDNHIKIVFTPAAEVEKLKAARLPYRLPEGDRVFSRKAQFQYGWDFGPRFPACGIWKKVSLLAWDNLTCLQWQHRVLQLSDTLAEVAFIIQTKSDINRSLSFNLAYTDKDQHGNSVKKTSKRFMVQEGINNDTVVVSFKNPRLWWCNGYGNAHMYNVNLNILAGRQILADVNMPLGIRQVSLVTTPDSIGQSFYFTLNQKKIFVKGGNYVPGDVFLREQNVKDQIRAFQAANVNMLRVWGGGVYASDAFMEACDKAGIMVWQDFAFACAMYPGDEAFLQSVKTEVQQQGQRLCNHPSLALWCGNNESNEGWFNWGWQKQLGYTAADSLKIWQDYQTLFHGLIPNALKTSDPLTSYYASSPLYGWGRAKSLSHGDAHYWGVWWGMEPFETYTKKVGRFMSEYGFQSLPEMYVFKQICPADELQLNSKFVRAHQKHPSGFETIRTYMERDDKLPEDFQTYIYKSQLLQRDGMAMAIEAHRAAKPNCMGTMIWQMNDCWPGITWSAIDYYDGKKAVFHALKKLYGKHLLRISQCASGLMCEAVTDSLNNFDAVLHIKLKDFNSKLLWEKTWPIKMQTSNTVKLQIDQDELPAFDTSQVFVEALLEVGGQTLDKKHHFLVKNRNLKLPKPLYRLKKINETTYSIQANSFLKDVYLFDVGNALDFSDNFFDMQSGEQRVITLKERMLDRRVKEVKLMCLND